MPAQLFKASLRANNQTTSLFQSLLKQETPKESGKKFLSLYGVNEIDNCPWPQNAEGEYGKRFLTPLIKKGLSTFVENVQADLRVLICDQFVLPLTINHFEYENSYVCSPHNYYISYAREALKPVVPKKVYRVLNSLLWMASKVLKRYQVDKVVSVNNWLCSTNLYPALNKEQLASIGQFLQKEFPSHAIVFRSIDANMSPTCYKALKELGFDYIANRQIYFIEPHKSDLMEMRLFKSDLKLLQNCEYEIIEGEELLKEDLSRLIMLYRSLYIDKYSDLNPQFNEDFLRLAIDQKLLTFKALKKNGCVDGVVGYMKSHGKMFCPFFGYDLTKPKEASLYRLLSTLLMKQAHSEELCFHLSSGASTFKTIRKAKSSLEQMAVYHRHLPFKRQIPWRILEKLCNSIGITFMKRY